MNNNASRLSSPKNQNKWATLRRPEMKLLWGGGVDECGRFLDHKCIVLGTQKSQLSLRENQQEDSQNYQYIKSAAKETHKLNHNEPDLRQPGMGVSHQPPM